MAHRLHVFIWLNPNDTPPLHTHTWTTTTSTRLWPAWQHANRLSIFLNTPVVIQDISMDSVEAPILVPTTHDLARLHRNAQLTWLIAQHVCCEMGHIGTTANLDAELRGCTVRFLHTSW